MYSYEERLRAVELFLRTEKNCKATIRQLGYPTKNALKAWCADFECKGYLLKRYHRTKPKYSEEQQSTAVSHFMANGRCIAATIRCLDYPSRQKLSDWISERYPEEKQQVVGKARKGASS